MAELLERHPDLDAVFVASDAMAIGALHVLAEAGRRVPDDVAVVGFDDVPTAPYTNPPLTTVRQPFDEMAVALAQRLLAQLDAPDAVVDHVVFPTEHVRRGARPTAACRQRSVREKVAERSSPGPSTNTPVPGTPASNRANPSLTFVAGSTAKYERPRGA
jgi:hypothetical protein